MTLWQPAALFIARAGRDDVGAGCRKLRIHRLGTNNTGKL